MASNAAPPDSLSVRLSFEDWEEGRVYGIDWGVRSAAGASSAGFDFAALMIIQGEIFDPSVNYEIGVGTQMLDREFVWWDALQTSGGGTGSELFRSRNFIPYMPLRDSAHYLIIFPPPVDVAAPGALFDCVLTVRGEIARREQGVRL